jgi:hypothetical protein
MGVSLANKSIISNLSLMKENSCSKASISSCLIVVDVATVSISDYVSSDLFVFERRPINDRQRKSVYEVVAFEKRKSQLTAKAK